MSTHRACWVLLAFFVTGLNARADEHKHLHKHIEFGIQSARNGNWSNPATWKSARVPKSGDRVLIRRGTRVTFDAKSKDVIPLQQIVGTLTFARDRDTELNVAIVKVQNSLECSESGFACDFAGVGLSGPERALTCSNNFPICFWTQIRMRSLSTAIKTLSGPESPTLPEGE